MNSIAAALEDMNPSFDFAGARVEMRPAGLREGGGLGPDYEVTVRWGAVSSEFVAEVKAQNTPRVIDEAIRQARRYSECMDCLPMIICPYLGDRALDRLSREQVSGLDLCGNGVVFVPDKFLLRMSGKRNLYPESRPAKFAYRGSTAQVPRVFLRSPKFNTVSEIKAEVASAGGAVALSTVSKALARMVEDLVIARDEREIRLIQPEKLLDLLVESYADPKVSRRVRVQISGSLGDVFERLQSGERFPRLMLSGRASQPYYNAGMRSDEVVIYCSDLPRVDSMVGNAWSQSDRYADATVLEISEPTPFLDFRWGSDGIAYASPVQSYLELVNGGDKRDKEMAFQIREKILQGLGFDTKEQRE